jgi:hypothetical protein
MLKKVGKFEVLSIVNLNLFIIALFNDFKSYVNMFIILNGAITLIECSFRLQKKCNLNEIT